MEVTSMSIAISLVCIVLVSVSWCVLNWVWFKPKRLERCLRNQGFKGNSYRLLHGDTKDRATMTIEARTSPPLPDSSNDYLPRVLPFFLQTLNKYGRRCFVWNGPVPLVTIAEPELIREVFMKIHEFQKPRTNPLLEKVASGLVMLEGQFWATRRKLLTPAFHMDKLKFMLPALWESSSAMVKEWEEMASKTGSCEIEVWTYLRKLSADLISRAAFGSSYEEGKRIFELLIEQIQIAIPVFNAVYIPGWRFIPTKANRRIVEIDKECRTLLKGVIDKRKKAIKEGEKPKDDLLGLLLESKFQDNGHNNKKQIELSIEEVINESKLFYLAGQGTTSTLLVWTLIMLGKYQEWQARAREEILNTFGNRIPDFQGLNHLKTVNMIFQEVLRLYPPVLEISRTVTDDIRVGDVFLPGGVLVNLPIALIQQDEKLWGDDAKEFNPLRFSEGISKATKGNMSFFSFGWGPRICIGSNFAMIEAKMTLALILQRFSFELSPSYVHAPSTIGGLRPQFDAPIVFHQF
ncbi:cytochrome P450 CYP72A219-like [Chenopodium quinoa]|nr:cytochrome P450 CYP72A219-like [Chenopodium quinoa]